MWLAMAFACGAKDPEVELAPGQRPASGEVHLETRDGVSLVGDRFVASTAGRPGVLLLHMIPPQFDRTSWPDDFVARLHGHDWNVLVLDRRGAGDSGGEAEEAYDGEKGRYDAEAAVKSLAELGLGPLVIVGASNGTATMLDYAAWGPTEGLPGPVALGFLSGGDYTEANTAMSQIPAVPAYFAYPAEEAAWNDVQKRHASAATWEFKVYDPGDHGTKMFGKVEAFDADLEAWLVARLTE